MTGHKKTLAGAMELIPFFQEPDIEQSLKQSQALELKQQDSFVIVREHHHAGS